MDLTDYRNFAIDDDIQLQDMYANLKMNRIRVNFRTQKVKIFI